MCNQNCVIAIGDVFHLRCKNCNPPKPKFFVVVQSEPLRMILINSSRTDYQEQRADHVAVIPVIRQHGHPFLSHDSYLGCNELTHEYNHAELAAMVNAKPAIRLGALDASARESVAGAFRHNELVPRKYLRDLRQIWP